MAVEGSDVILFLFPLILGLGLTGVVMAIRGDYREEKPVCGVKARSQPPGWVFGVVWPILYTLLGLALALLWRNGDRMWSWPVIAVIIGVIGLQVWWLLFTTKCIPWGAFSFLVALGAWFVYVAVIAWPISAVAGGLLIPLLLWISFASYLSLEIAMGRVEKSEAVAVEPTKK
jgi:tryptophan-rich sensory protein